MVTGSVKRSIPWLLVLLNFGALAATLAQIVHLIHVIQAP